MEEKAESPNIRCMDQLGSKDNGGPLFQLQKEPEMGIRDRGGWARALKVPF